MGQRETLQKTIPSVPALACIWQKCVTSTIGGTEKSLTPKEFGQLKMLRNQLEDVTPAVIVWAVNNWLHFSIKVRGKAGLTRIPDRPHIGFLLTHFDVAVNLIHTEEPEQVATLMSRWKKSMDEVLDGMPNAFKGEPVTQQPAHTSQPSPNPVLNPKNVLGEVDYKPYKPSPEELQIYLRA